jgi:hypothetical protein
MKTLSSTMLSFVERLAEMFPQQDYQSRLEQYIHSKRPTNAAEVEYWQRQYDYNSGSSWSRSL